LEAVRIIKVQEGESAVVSATHSDVVPVHLLAHWEVVVIAIIPVIVARIIVAAAVIVGRIVSISVVF